MNECNFESTKIGFIGGGNMAKAIGFSLIRKGIINVKNVWVSALTHETLDLWKDLGANGTFVNSIVFENCDIIFLTVKPNMLQNVIDDIFSSTVKPYSNKSPLFVSVLVGIQLHTLTEVLGRFIPSPRIIRCIPNTPVLVGKGITAYCSMNTTNEDKLMVHELLSHIGIAESVPESLMNAIGGLSGSGPAYAYLIIEALSDGAVKMGVPRPMATKFAAQVLAGAGKMVLETHKHPCQLKDEVCSAGGTTITGIHAMECGQVRASMMNAVEAAVKKSNEMFSE